MNNVLMRYAMVMTLCLFYQVVEAQEISSFSLINYLDNTEIGNLSDGDSISIRDFEVTEFDIRANTIGTIGSVVFRLDGQIIGASNVVPYTFVGSTGKDEPWIPEVRTYTIVASVHSLPQGQGTQLSANHISVTFIEEISEEPIGPEVQSLILINADTDEDIAEIVEGSVFSLVEIGTRNLNIRAETSAEAESVVFDYQGTLNYHTENLVEYAIGANDDDDYRPWQPELGPNSVSATAFTKDLGKGNAGNPLTVNFEIVETLPEPVAPFELRINSGGEALVLNDSLHFVADTLFTGNGRPFSNTNIIDILETDQDSLYKTERTTNGALQSFAYTIPLSDGAYEIRFHFAEIYWGATGGGPGGIGRRVFSVSIEDENVLVDYDMSSEKDPMTAIIKTFPITVTDGELNIDFGASVDQPKVSALEIIELDDTVAPSEDCVWEELATATAIKTETQSVKLNGKLFVMGHTQSDSLISSITEIYDPTTNSWSLGTPVPSTDTFANAIGVLDDIWLIGGYAPDSLQSPAGDIHIYNTINDTWSIGPAMPSTGSSVAAAFSEGKVYLLAGVSQDSLVEGVEHYVFDVNDSIAQWQVAAPLPDPREHLGLVAHHGKIYAIGGQNEPDSLVRHLPFLDEYDPMTDIWTRKADLPSGHSQFESSLDVYDNKIVVTGGQKDESLAKSILEYDITSDSWTERCALPPNFELQSAKVFDNQLLVTSTGEKENPSATIAITLQSELPEEPETPEEDLSVLVYHETGGFRHNSIEAGIAMVSEFGNELGWNVKESQTSAIFQSDSLATYDVVLWLNTTGEGLLTVEEQSAFEGFIQNGGGFVGVHSATDTYRNGSWPWYNDLVGAIVQVNPYHTANNTNAIIDVVGEHPVVTHLGTEWNKNEEYYYWERNGGYLFEGNIDLLRVRSTGLNSYDAPRPVTWYKNYDGGRSFYTALGHNAADYESNANFRTMLLEAILWAADKEDESEDVADEPESDDDTDTGESYHIELYPNPVLDLLYIDTQGLAPEFSGEIAIFGLDGNLRLKKTIDQNNPHIDLSYLAPGYYAASITIGAISERHLIYKN